MYDRNEPDIVLEAHDEPKELAEKAGGPSE